MVILICIKIHHLDRTSYLNMIERDKKRRREKNIIKKRKKERERD